MAGAPLSKTRTPPQFEGVDFWKEMRPWRKFPQLLIQFVAPFPYPSDVRNETRGAISNQPTLRIIEILPFLVILMSTCGGIGSKGANVELLPKSRGVKSSSLSNSKARPTNAAVNAKTYLNVTGFSRSGLITQLEFVGFNNQQSEYVTNANGLS